MIQRAMMMAAVAALLTMSPDVALAQPASTYPGLSVEFRDRTGTGSAIQSFEVWMRIVNNGPTDFNFDGSAPVNAFGLPLLSLPALGRDGSGSLVSFADYTSAFFAPFWDCAGNFVASNCGNAGAYTFGFNGGANSLYGVTSLNIAKNGGFFDYLVGTLSPTGGSAPTGTYRFFNSGFFVGVEGVDAVGNHLIGSLDVDLAAACTNGATHPDCNFVRDISNSKSVDENTVTPEPATIFMLGGGLAVLAMVLRRRRRNS